MKNRRGVNVYNTTSPRTCDVLNVLCRKLANPMGKYNLQCFTWNTPSLSPLQKWLLYSSPSSGAFKQLINRRWRFATHSGTHVLTLVSDGSDSFTTRSPGPPFCHHPSLSERSGLASPSAPTPVEGTRAPSCPPRSPPSPLSPPPQGPYRVRPQCAAPSPHCCVAAVGTWPEHCHIFKAVRAARRGCWRIPWTPPLARQVRRTKRCPNPEQEICRLEGNPRQGRAAPGDAVPAVSPATAPREERREVPAERGLPGRLFGSSNRSTRSVCSELHQRPPATQRTWEVQSCVETGVKALFSSSLPSRMRQRLAGTGCLRAFKATEMSVALYQLLIEVKVEGRPGSEAQHKYHEID